MKLNKLFLINLLIFIIVFIIVFLFGFWLLSQPKNIASAQDLSQYGFGTEEVKDIIPPDILDISVDTVTATSATISWTTDELADSLVNYGLDKRFGVVRDPRADKINHQIIIDDLLPGTIYYFRITSSDIDGNQGISSDYSFTTERDEVPTEEQKKTQDIVEEIVSKGIDDVEGGGVEAMLKVIDKITSEKVLEKIQEKLKQKAEEVAEPPIIILDMADIELGTDYAIIRWETDKESNSMVALAREDQYDEGAEDPYIWNEGEPSELVTTHEVVVNGLSPATNYHFKVSSEDALGLAGYSRDRVFRTKSILPEIYNIQIAKVEEDSATIKWVTNIPCSSILDYTNLNTNETKLEGSSAFLTNHTIKLTNLIFDTYYSVVINVESEDGEKSSSEALTFITIRDELPPVISKVKTESTLYPGTENRIQTIATWETDEPAQCQLFYHQGLVVIDEPQNLAKEEDFGSKHVQVVTNFLPSTVYKFWIICSDEADNIVKSEDFTMLTPTQEESIIDIIIKNFESTFGWVKQVGQ